MPDLNQMMQMARKMAQEVEEKKNSLEKEGNAGGGMVRVRMNGHHQVIAVAIAPEVVDPDDVEMLQDLVTAAVNDARSRVDEAMKDELGGMGIPGMPGGLPF